MHMSVVFLKEDIKIKYINKSEAAWSPLPGLPIFFLNRIFQQLLDFKEDILKSMTTMFGLSLILGPEFSGMITRGRAEARQLWAL